MSSRKRTNNTEEKKDKKNNKSAKTVYTFPTDKLTKKTTNKLPKCVLLLVGSFSPITYMHLRLLGE